MNGSTALKGAGKSFKTFFNRCSSLTSCVIIIVISKLLKRHLKAKRKAPAYSRAASNQRGFPKNSPREAQVRLPEGERMRQIRGVFSRIVRGKLRSGCQRVIGGRLGVKAGVVLEG